MSGTEGLFELECKKDLLWVMARYLSYYLEKESPGGLAGIWLVLGGEPTWGDNKVDVVSTAMAIEVSHSRENEYVSE
jgi:hypothetical protein